MIQIKTAGVASVLLGAWHPCEDSMTRYSRKALVGDIGSTNIRLAISDIDELTISDFAMLRSGDFSDPRDAIERYLKTIPQAPNMVGLAIAGPVANGKATMANRNWTFDREAIRTLTKADHVLLLNDFEALAWALPHLTSENLHTIHDGTPANKATKAALGPGTGLGVAALVPSASGWVAVPSEGGHVTFRAQGRQELDLLDQMSEGPGTLTTEDVLSGRGLMKLHRLLSGGKEELSTPEIVRAALVRADSTAKAALTQFIAWLGRYAADIALVYGARGGIYLGGGIAPNMVKALANGAFGAAFEDSSRHSAYLSAIPVYVIKTGADAGLRGAAVALSLTVQELASGGRVI